MPEPRFLISRDQGGTALFEIVNGSMYQLEATEAEESLTQGYYDAEMNLVEPIGGESVDFGVLGADSNMVDFQHAWVEAEHPRGKTSVASTPGSFAPREGMVFAHDDRERWPEHVRSLKVPPAWTGVQYSEDPDAHLLVVGVDAKGRQQYVYSKEWSESQAAAKFAKTRELDAKFEGMRAQALADAKAGNPDAEAASLVFATGMRPGSDSDTGADKQAYGATTLEGRHVLYNGKRLKFTGKSGKDLYLPVNDPEVANMLSRRRGETTPKGRLFPEVSNSSLRDYIKTLNGGGFSTKDIRTAIGTRAAKQQMGKMRVPKTLKEYKKAVRTVGKHVSEVLGNTPTVALQSYIDPTLFGGWRNAARV